MPDTQLPDSYPLEFQESYAKTYNNKPQIQSVLKPFMNFISKCRKQLTLFFHSLSLRVVLPYGWPSPPVNGSRSHRTHSLNKKKKGGAHEEKLLFTCVSSKVKNTRIQHRSPWPSRPYDPPAHGGIRSGLSFPPCSPLCCADACLSASHREQILHAQEAGTSPCLLSLQNLPP